MASIASAQKEDDLKKEEVPKGSRRNPPTLPPPKPIDCVWEDWSDWTRCSETCGGGDMERTREVRSPSRNGGAECQGSPEQSTSCEKEECPTSPTTSMASIASAQKEDDLKKKEVPKGEVEKKEGFPSKMLMIGVGVGVLVLGAGGGGLRYYMLRQKATRDPWNPHQYDHDDY